MRRMAELINLLIRGSDTVIGNGNRIGIAFSRNANEDMTALPVMIHTVLNQIAYRPFH